MISAENINGGSITEFVFINDVSQEIEKFSSRYFLLGSQ
jgi:hypothetical protein